jgi:hypothetical protein
MYLDDDVVEYSRLTKLELGPQGFRRAFIGPLTTRPTEAIVRGSDIQEESWQRV